jgi:hypothetical protein
MNQSQFLDQLSAISNSYTWSYEDGTIVGTARNGNARGQVFNPITAIARSTRVGEFSNTKRDTTRAARSLGLSTSTLNGLYCHSNRGNAQVLRGRMRSALNIT